MHENYGINISRKLYVQFTVHKFDYKVYVLYVIF